MTHFTGFFPIPPSAFIPLGSNSSLGPAFFLLVILVPRLNFDLYKEEEEVIAPPWLLQHLLH